MLTGHYAPAIALHRLTPTAPLWAYLLAAQAVDVAFMLLGLFNIESAALSNDVPRLVVTAGVWTHSLPATAAWSLAAAALTYAILRNARAAATIAACVASHWLTDYFVHTPDLPLGFTQHPAVGLGLWLHPPWAWALECGLLLAAAAFLAPTLQGTAKRRLWSLVIGLLVLQTLSEFVIPTPPTFAELAASALAVYTAVAWLGSRIDAAKAAAT